MRSIGYHQCALKDDLARSKGELEEWLERDVRLGLYRELDKHLPLGTPVVLEIDIRWHTVAADNWPKGAMMVCQGVAKWDTLEEHENDALLEKL